MHSVPKEDCILQLGVASAIQDNCLNMDMSTPKEQASAECASFKESTQMIDTS